MSEPPTASTTLGLRRHLAILFADLSGSTAIARRMEAEDFALLLTRFRALCRRVVDDHSGQTVRLQGDGVLAVFGLPEAAEDAPWRAIRAALKLCEFVADLGLNDLPPLGAPLQAHCGVHAGLVLVGSGDVELGRLDLIGDLPNVAAKLSAYAGPGQVFTSLDALGPFAAHFIVGDEVDVPLATTGVSVRAAEVQGLAAPRRHFDARLLRGQARFVGRDAELSQLLAFARNAPPGALQLATLVAGPGLGKSRLLEELGHRLGGSGLLVLRGYCEAYLGTEVLQPFLQMARSLLGMPAFGISQGTGVDALRALHAKVAALAGEAVATSVLAALRLQPANEANGPAAEALADFVVAQALRKPLLLIIDDWQWADDASLHALRVLIASAPPLRVILASREPELALWSKGHAPQITLPPLSLQDTSETTRDLLPDADPLLVRELHRLAGGVPLYVEELCHAASAGNGLGIVREAPRGSAWLELLIDARLKRLNGALVDFITLCAVIGTTVPLSLLAQLLPDADAERLGEEAERADFLVRHPVQAQLAFKHGLTRDAVYGLLAPVDRRRIHRHIYDVLLAQAADGDAALEALAWHSSGAGLRAEAAGLAESAGDRALSSNAFDVARRMYASATKLCEEGSVGDPEQWRQVCRLAGKLGIACVFDPLALSDGVGLFERALAAAEALGGAQEAARARYWLGYICYAKGHVRRALRHGRLAVAQADALGERRLAAQARATLGQILVAAGDYSSALPLLDQALEGKRADARPGSGVAVGSAYALACAGCLLGDQGRFEAAEQRFREALALLGDSGHPVGSSVRGWISAVHLWQGRWQEALDIAREGELIAEQARVRQLLAMCRALSGYARWRLEGDRSAVEQVLEATRWIQLRQGGFFTSLNFGWLVEMTAAAGETRQARHFAASLFSRARQGDRMGQAMGCRALATLAARAGQRERAAHYLRVARDTAAHRGSAHEAALNLAAAGTCAALAGDVEVAAAFRLQADAALLELHMHGHLATGA